MKYFQKKESYRFNVCVLCTVSLSCVCSLAVAVEDAMSSCCVTVKVAPHMTVASLKQQVCETV